MIGLSVNISTLYQDIPFSDRFQAAKDDGFAAIEFWPGEDLGVISRQVQLHDLTVSVLNINPGPDGSHGELSNPDAVDWWQSALDEAVAFARDINCQTLCALTGNRDERIPLELQLSTAAQNLARGLERVAGKDLDLVLEPISPDRPTYLTRTVEDARRIHGAAGAPARLGLLFDAYHLYATESVSMEELLLENSGWTKHIQLADRPGRFQPGTGDIDWPAFMRGVHESGYDGWITYEGYARDGENEQAISAFQRLLTLK